MDRQLRKHFDKQLQQVLPQLPQRVQQLLHEVPLYVEDHPSRQLMRKLRVRRRDSLCGLYTGIPLTQRSVDQDAVLSDVIHIFREGILAMAADEYGQLDQEELRRQIRITILHELGHHHGLSEEELASLGY